MGDPVSANDSGDLDFSEFLGDYFVECEEHLSDARRCLLALEPSVGQGQIDRGLLDELFRSFHSLKGLSAMVGVRGAEELAHQLESYLGQLRKGQSRLSAEGLETLITGVKALDGIIAAHREKLPPPDLAALIAQVTALLREKAEAGPPTGEPNAINPRQHEAPLSPEKAVRVGAALRAGAKAWRFTFTPSPELAERGVNVNVVRERLQGVGDLHYAAPIVTEGGKIAFSFIVTSQADEATFSNWTNDGLTFAAYELPEKENSPELPPPRSLSVPSLSASNLVRVDLGRLDDLMHKVGGLVISRARLEDSLKRLASSLPSQEWRSLQETNQAIERQLRDLREAVMRVRMVPVREIFARMQFVVRDLTREFGKKAVLALTGEETEIDKFVVERMMDPLLHLVRNAVSHGIETPEERVASGKPREAQIFLRAGTTGETILIEVEDDGRGIDAETVFAKARATGLVPDGAPTDPATMLDIICAPSFSTREEPDRASGRGVGMDVVRRVVEELGGTLTLHTHVGQGTRFAIQLPLTLAIADALIVAVGGQTYAVPQVAVREVIQVQPESLTALENNEILSYHGGVLPLLRLTAFFGSPTRPEGAFYALVVGEGIQAVGIAVDRVLGLREIVVRPLADPLVQVPGVGGATELGDGRAVLILDTAALARAARRQRRGERSKVRSSASARVVLLAGV